MAYGAAEGAPFQSLKLTPRIYRDTRLSVARLFRIFEENADCAERGESGVAEADAASPVGDCEQDHGGEGIGCGTAGGESRAYEIETGQLMSGADIPPYGVERLERNAATAPDTERQGQTWDEDGGADPGGQTMPIGAQQKPESDAATSECSDGDARSPESWKLAGEGALTREQ